MLGGIRTGEARALRWSEVDHEAGPAAVYRSVRRSGEDQTGTPPFALTRKAPSRAAEILTDRMIRLMSSRNRGD
jgi:integrase